jgi:uncharacterized membrane protein
MVPILAMHMANEMLSFGVASALIAMVAAFLVFASRRAGRQLDETRAPLMGVMGAVVFAAQMINFPILPGTSGHICGTVLLAVLLGPHAATLVMASILIVQCLIFQDGGLLALGGQHPEHRDCPVVSRLRALSCDRRPTPPGGKVVRGRVRRHRGRNGRRRGAGAL